VTASRRYLAAVLLLMLALFAPGLAFAQPVVGPAAEMLEPMGRRTSGDYRWPTPPGYPRPILGRSLTVAEPADQLVRIVSRARLTASTQLIDTTPTSEQRGSTVIPLTTSVQRSPFAASSTTAQSRRLVLTSMDWLPPAVSSLVVMT
jgi:hypothetical protein